MKKTHAKRHFGSITGLPMYSKTETDLYRGITVIHATATSDDVDFTPVDGNTVTRDQTDWSLVLALPHSQMGQFVRGESSSSAICGTVQMCNAGDEPTEEHIQPRHCED